MAEEQKPQRQFAVQRIYTKDISFEVPNTPQAFESRGQPEININLGTEVNRVSDTSIELTLNVSVDAKHGDSTLFLVEVHQGGLFLVSGFNEQEVDALMGVAAPNVLFPYVREVGSDLVPRGSFPQFVLQPVNFEALYAQQKKAKAEGAETVQ